MLVEDHRQDAAFQRAVGVGHAFGQAGARGLARPGVVDDGAQGGAVVIGKVQEMLGRRLSRGRSLCGRLLHFQRRRGLSHQRHAFARFSSEA